MDGPSLSTILKVLFGIGAVGLIIRGLMAASKKTGSLTQSNAISLWKGVEELLIEKITECTHDVKSFELKRQNGKGFSGFKAGQFLSFEIAGNSKCLRSYSILTSSESANTIEVSVKKLDGGVGSSWLHNLKEGDALKAFAPSGLFTDVQFPTVSKVYIAGGIGITPILSMVRSNIDKGLTAPLYLFYGMKTLNDMAFHDEITKLAAENSFLKYYPVFSEEEKDIEFDKGFITTDYIASKLVVSDAMKFYLCGPEVMTDSIIESLKKQKISKKNIFNEKFASPEAAQGAVAGEEVTINFNGTDYHYNGKETILEFMESQGENIVFACRAGVCGSCVCRLKEGEVDSATDAGLTDEEIYLLQKLAGISKK